MSDEIWQAFSQRVAYVDNLPVALEPRHARTIGADLFEERNLHVLGTLATLEERRLEAGRTEAGDDAAAVMQELVRLDNKLNVLMDIVGRLLMPDGDLPPRSPIRLNALGAEIPSELCAGRDTSYFLRIHFDACRALPLMLPASYGCSCGPDRVFLSFEGLKPAVEEGMEKLVFRQHRRKVAEARQAGP